MHLKSLTLRGFKSFASTTVFDFDPGINAVVGPNGSGKSNLVDALSWVLGEQGAKSLRGAVMQDVIFAGTASRQPLGRARVNLVIDNSDSTLPIPATEIEISRTVFRSGGSEYELNGVATRLADIQDLLADVGLGKSQHSMVGQGQIEAALHATAADRRIMIEEAAGILKYRRKVEKTERKLDSMRSNLNRLEDLETELAAQLEPLEEQAEAARDARELQAQIRSIRADLLAYDAQIMQRQKKQQSKQIATLLTQKATIQKAADSCLDSVKELEEKRSRLREDMRVNRQAKTDLERTSARLQATAAVAAERCREEKDSADHHRLAERLEIARLALAAERHTAKKEEELKAHFQEQQEKAISHSKQIRQKLKSLEEELAETTRKTGEHRETIAQLTAHLAAARARFERAVKEAKERRTEAERAQTAIEISAEEQNRAQAQLTASSETIKQLQTDKDQARTRRHNSSNQLKRAEEKLAEAKLHTQTLRARRATLKESLPSGVSTAGIEFPQLHEFMTVKPGWEKAVSRALIHLAEARVGTATGTETDYSTVFTPSSTCPETLDLPDEVLSATDVLSVREPARLVVQTALAQTVFVPEDTRWTDCASLFDHHPELTVVRADGTVFTDFAILVAEDRVHGVIEIAALIAQTETELEAACEVQNQAEEKCRNNRVELEGAQAHEKTIAQSMGRAQVELNRAEAALAGITSRSEAAYAEQKRLEKKSREANEREQTAQQELETATCALDTAIGARPHQDNQTLQTDISRARENLEEAQSRYTALVTRQDSIHQQAEQTRQRIERAEKEVDDLQESINQLQAQHKNRQRRQLAAASVEAKAKLLDSHLQAELHQAIQKIAAAAETGREIDQQIQARREEHTDLRKQLDALVQSTGKLEIARVRFETQRENLEKRSLDELGEELLNLITSFEKRWSEVAKYDRKKHEGELVERQRKLMALGNVNPLALEEFSALEERHSYLVDQIRDLKKSRADMRSLLKDLNRHIRKEFETVFNETKEHFEQIFAELFDGGEGTLVLTNPNDPLNTGVDIQARPAGKKVKRLSLLSGGERALASLALLTAIFATRPSPFYVLDEVEAALDDRNLSRVLGVLEQLGKKSQLIIITHKPRTVEIGQTLFGVSMADGVSQVFSQSAAEIREAL